MANLIHELRIIVANYPVHPYNSGHCLVCCITANSDIKFKV
jgi:diadenosine tetraphosphate (Ap4A) HIT family hydrolase